MGTTKERELIAAAIARFPTTFRLRALPGGEFRISDSDSYFRGPGEAGGELMLCTEKYYTEEEYRRLCGCTETDPSKRWVSFSKGTESELKAGIK